MPRLATDAELEAFEDDVFPRPALGSLFGKSLHAPQNVHTLGFGRDNDGELYVMGKKTGTPSGSTGEVRKLVEP